MVAEGDDLYYTGYTMILYILRHRLYPKYVILFLFDNNIGRVRQSCIFRLWKIHKKSNFQRRKKCVHWIGGGGGMGNMYLTYYQLLLNDLLWSLISMYIIYFTKFAIIFHIFFSYTDIIWYFRLHSALHSKFCVQKITFGSVSLKIRVNWPLTQFKIKVII